MDDPASADVPAIFSPTGVRAERVPGASWTRAPCRHRWWRSRWGCFSRWARPPGGRDGSPSYPSHPVPWLSRRGIARLSSGRERDAPGFSCAPSPQLPSLLRRTGPFSHGHVDPDGGPVLADVPIDRSGLCRGLGCHRPAGPGPPGGFLWGYFSGRAFTVFFVPWRFSGSCRTAWRFPEVNCGKPSAEWY